MPYLFSYGTLQKQNVQIELFGRLLRGDKDVLERYKTVTIEIKDPAFLAKGENKYQQTLMTSGNENDYYKRYGVELTEDELHQADKYEPDNYSRKLVKLQSGKEV